LLREPSEKQSESYSLFGELDLDVFDDEEELEFGHGLDDLEEAGEPVGEIDIIIHL
jgi:hypothetical protein